MPENKEKTQNLQQDSSIIEEANLLFVPIEVDALYLNASEAANLKFAKPAVDFSKLPYINGKERVNSKTAFISEEIVIQAFDKHENLEAGVHLYWKLPSFLKHAYTLQGSEDYVFPKLPDYWLITRFDNSGYNSFSTKSWLLKSAALEKDGKGITVPSSEKETVPFAYLGKKIALDSLELFSPESKFPLTTIGYGDPVFSSVYTNCKNVFGFFDDLKDLSNDPTKDLGYHVCGWYSDPIDDPLALSSQSTNLSKDSLTGALSLKEQILKFAGVDSKYKSDLHLFCNGGVINISRDGVGTTIKKPFEDLRLYIGNTVEEAVASLLAQESVKDKRPEMEKLLNAFQLGLIQKIDQVDGSKIVDELIQSNRFISEAGEQIWIIKTRDSETKNNNLDQIKADFVQLSPNISNLIEILNKKEQEFQQISSKLESYKFQLFCDWYKFMLIHYSDDIVEIRETPDDDKLRTFILYKISRIKKIESDREDLKKQLDEKKAALEKALILENGAKYILKQINGPRYWKPKEPVLLFFSKEFLNLKKQNEKVLVKQPSMQAVLDILKKLGSIYYKQANNIDSVKTGDGYTFLNLFNTETFNAFNYFNLFQGNDFRAPLLMDWEVTCYLTERNADENAGFYDPTYIQNKFDLNEFHAELSPKLENRYVNNFTHSGMTILSNSGAGSLQYQMKSLNLDFAKEGSFFDQIYAQSIGGFNDELLMFKSTAQLTVKDPMAETPYLKQFTEFVSQIVGKFNLKAPQPNNHFMPIREGVVKVNKVRFTDHFGQIVDLPIQPNNVFVSSTMTSSTATDHFYLSPRIVQASRLHLRWCSAKDKTVEAVPSSANSPILAWILHDKFDNTLTFYHPTGEMLCELNDKDPNGTIEIIGSNGKRNTYGQSTEMILKSANEHVSKLIIGVMTNGGKPMYRFANDKKRKAESQSYFRTLVEQIDLALANINPVAEDNNSISMLFGKPLAIVRASLDFQLNGFPSANYSWEKMSSFLKWDENRLMRVLENEAFDSMMSDGFCDVKLPVKLGDFNKQNDSLVVYFRENGGGCDFTKFYANEENSYFSVNPNSHEDYNIYLSVNNPAAYITMFMFPVGTVHAVTGVLPVKSIDLPSIYYQDFMRNFEISFRIGPILTNKLDEAYFAAYKPAVDEDGFTNFKLDVVKTIAYLRESIFTNHLELIRYIEKLDISLLSKFKALLLPRALYFVENMDQASQILETSISAINKMLVYIEDLLKVGVSNLISIAKIGEDADLNLKMEKVAKTYFKTERVAFLLSHTEWQEAKARFLKKYEQGVNPEIEKIIEKLFIDIPFSTVEKAQVYLLKLLKDYDLQKDLAELVLKYGLEPESEMYVPVAKSEASSWSFLVADDTQINEFNLKDDQTNDQFETQRVRALDGWLLLKNKS